MTSPSSPYTALLTHLHNPKSALSSSTIQAALAFHLANLEPLPNPLAAAAVSAPFYLSSPYTHEKLQSLATAFRHATHLKYRAVAKTAHANSLLASLFAKSVKASVAQWVLDVLKGVQGGNSVLRLAACSGLLLGIQDLKASQKEEKHEGVDIGLIARGRAEDEVVVALAEVMDSYAYRYDSTSNSWEKEFQPAAQDVMPLAIIIASQSLPQVSHSRIKALPLPVLANILSSIVSDTFQSGSLLQSLSQSITRSSDNKIYIHPTSPFAQSLHTLTSSPLLSSIAPISRLTATVLTLLLDNDNLLHSGLLASSQTLEIMRELTARVEQLWSATPLASATEDELESTTQDLTKSIWTMLKTILFSSIMISDAILSAVVFLPPSSSSASSSPSPTPSSLALQTLHILSHLSFVISQFGGVTSTSQGFGELKKTFYLALDILAQGEGEAAWEKANTYVRESCALLESDDIRKGDPSMLQAKQAYVLASIEQLVPVLTDQCIKDIVWNVCYRHLDDPTHRETYESAHSVVLTIFASDAQKRQRPPSKDTIPSTRLGPLDGLRRRIADNQRASRKQAVTSEGDHANEENDPGTDSSSTFVRRMVPFYANCLIENSQDGKLSTPQLQLAYSALVRSASASAFTFDTPPDRSYALSWYCIEALLSAITNLSAPPSPKDVKGKGKEQTSGSSNSNEKNKDRLHRLHLMLISTIPSLPLPLMLRALEETRAIIVSLPLSESSSGNTAELADKGGERDELVQALFSEILDRVGDLEKEAAMRWWYENRPILVYGQETEGGASVSTPSQDDSSQESGASAGANQSSFPLSRL